MPDLPAGVTVMVVTGSRWLTSEELVFVTLDTVAGEFSWNVGLLHGACPPRRKDGVVVAWGADMLAARWARNRGVPAEAMPAIWRPGGRLDLRAGFTRNDKMIAKAAAAASRVCIPFEKAGEENRGTRHCYRRAAEAGIDTRPPVIEPAR